MTILKNRFIAFCGLALATAAVFFLHSSGALAQNAGRILASVVWGS
jgi:hypothetical protein